MSELKAAIENLLKEAEPDFAPGGYECFHRERKSDGSVAITIRFRKTHEDATGTVRHVDLT